MYYNHALALLVYASDVHTSMTRVQCISSSGAKKSSNTNLSKDVEPTANSISRTTSHDECISDFGPTMQVDKHLYYLPTYYLNIDNSDTWRGVPRRNTLSCLSNSESSNSTLPLRSPCFAYSRRIMASISPRVYLVTIKTFYYLIL